MTDLTLGLTAMLTDETISPMELAVEAEARGFSSLFLPEHTHIPVSRDTPHPLAATLPREYARTLDPFVALTSAAAATSTIRVGTGICLLAARDVLITAKEVATLDLCSGGRFVLGVGYGWNREELADHGVAWEHRRAVTHEKVTALRSLWADEQASHDGEHVRFAPTFSWPKPQAGSVPIWFGSGAGPKGLAAAARHADAWMPHGTKGVAEALPALAAACDDVGRDPADVAVVPFGVLPTEGKLDHLVGLGITEVVALITSVARDDALAQLDAIKATWDRWLG